VDVPSRERIAEGEGHVGEITAEKEATKAVVLRDQ